VTVDGGNQRSIQFREKWRAKEPLDVGFRATDDFGFARAWYRLGYDAPGAGEVHHRRSVFFVPGRYAVIYDLVEGTGEHEVALHWSFPPLEVKADGAERVVVRPAESLSQDPGNRPAGSRSHTGRSRSRTDSGMGAEGGCGLVMGTKGTGELNVRVRKGEKDPPAGWFSRVYSTVHAAPHVEMTSRVSLPARFATVLCPFRGKDAPEVSIRLDPLADERVTVTIGDREETLTPESVAPAE
jgi:hypothetical protein